MKNIFERLNNRFERITSKYRNNPSTQLDRAATELIKEDADVIKKSLLYWSNFDRIALEFLENLESLNRDLRSMMNSEEPQERIDLSLEYPKIDKEEVLEIDELESLITEIETLESLGEDSHGMSPEHIESLRGDIQKYEEKFNEVKKSQNELRERLDSHKGDLQEAYENASKLKQQTSNKEVIRICDNVLKILESLDFGNSSSRRDFLKAVGTTAAGITGLTYGDEVYSEANEKFNDVAFRFMGTLKSTDPKEYYANTEDYSTIASAVCDREIDIKIHNVIIGDQKPEKYPRKEIMGFLSQSFSQSFGVKLNLSWNNQRIKDVKIEESKYLGETLEEISLRQMGEKEIKLLNECLRHIIGQLRADEEVTCLIIRFKTGFLEPRAVAGSKVISVNREDPRTLEYLLAHEIGHTIGLPHNNGTDVMSYSPERFIKGELGLLDQPFGSDSIKNWGIIQKIHKEKRGC